jgi:hypothetical protein
MPGLLSRAVQFPGVAARVRRGCGLREKIFICSNDYPRSRIRKPASAYFRAFQGTRFSLTEISWKIGAQASWQLADATSSRTVIFAGDPVRIWLRGLDSNQDNQLQRLACYQLHYPGFVFEIVADMLRFCFAGSPTPHRRLPLCLRFATLLNARRRGEVSERFKEHAWKACVGETLPWVRIPPSPPFFLF